MGRQNQIWFDTWMMINLMQFEVKRENNAPWIMHLKYNVPLTQTIRKRFPWIDYDEISPNTVRKKKKTIEKLRKRDGQRRKVITWLLQYRFELTLKETSSKRNQWGFLAVRREKRNQSLRLHRVDRQIRTSDAHRLVGACRLCRIWDSRDRRVLRHSRRESGTASEKEGRTGELLLQRQRLRLNNGLIEDGDVAPTWIIRFRAITDEAIKKKSGTDAFANTSATSRINNVQTTAGRERSNRAGALSDCEWTGNWQSAASLCWQNKCSEWGSEILSVMAIGPRMGPRVLVKRPESGRQRCRTRQR